MTIGELKRYLSDIPDEYRVISRRKVIHNGVVLSDERNVVWAETDELARKVHLQEEVWM